MSKNLKTLSRAVLALIGTALITPAYAAVLFTVERIDDTHARLTGSGTLSMVAPPANDHVLALKSPFAINPLDEDFATDALASSTLKVGTQAVDFAFADSAGFDLFGDGSSALHFGTSGFLSFTPGAVVSGYLDLALTGGATFAAIGTSGLVSWGAFDFAGLPQDAGQWTMVAAAADVPEPGNLALGGVALAGLLMARRRTRS